MEALINMALLTLLAVVTLGVMRQRNMFGVIILFAIYSFLMASVFIVLDAVDVAMTEAAVGAGVSTVFLLAALHHTRSLEQRPHHTPLVPLLVSIVIGAALVWGTFQLSPFGSPEAVIHKHVAPRYLSQSIEETMVPNVVTSVLADYRSYDTLGETTVIFTGGIGVMLLLRGSVRRRREQPRSPEGNSKEETA